MKLIMLGAPGAGKGTQAQILAHKYSIPKLSTGDILRQAIQKGDATAMQLKSIMDAGNLVPDAVVINIIAEKLQTKECERGFILDGFPRTIAQADALEKMLKQLNINDHQVINLEVDIDELVKRISGRFTCKACGASYNVHYVPTRVQGVCDKCGGKEFLQREDDSETAVRKRLEVYREQTEPLKKFYDRRHRLVSIKGGDSIEKITREIMGKLRQFEHEEAFVSAGM